MKNKIKISIVSIISAFVVLQVSAQDIHFTQIQYFPLTLNPAMTGANYALSGNLIYRNQWKAVAAPYNTFGLSVDGRIKKSPKGHFFAGGLKFFSDNTGDLSLKTNDVTLNGAYHLRVQQGQYFGVGIYAGIIQKSINMNNAKWGSQYDNTGMAYNSSLPSNETAASNSFISPDAGLGFTYTYKKNEQFRKGEQNINFNVGFSAFHVNMPSSSYLKNSSDKIYIRYVAFANGDIGIGKSNFAVSPLLVFQLQGPTKELLAGLYGKYIFAKAQGQGSSGGSVSIGSIYRNKDAVTTNIVLEYDSYTIGFSYDINISQLKTISRGKGAMEIFVRYVLPSPYGPGSSKSRI